jgi:hypothetical protein
MKVELAVGGSHKTYLKDIRIFDKPGFRKAYEKRDKGGYIG